MPLDLVQTLADLVALPSVNPMGRPDPGPECFEHRVTDYLAGVFERLGLRYQRQTIEPNRENIIVRIDGDVQFDSGGSILLLEAHQDTVPADGMTIDPWRPVIRDGRLYGRGACDVKAGLAAMLAAVVRLAEDRPAGMPTIVLAATINEEHGFSGIRGLVEFWSQPGAVLPRKPDVAIVAEPTELDVVVAHKGVLRWKCHAHGRSAHSSRPEAGDNAIYRMARVVSALEHYAREIVPLAAEHPLCGRPTLSVGPIHGGVAVNTVAELATIEIDRRLVPGEQARNAQRSAIKYLAEKLPGDGMIVHDDPYLIVPALEDRDNGPLAEALAAEARAVAGRSEKIAVPYGTNAAIIAEAGVPAVVFGPGSIAQAHTADEWVALDQVEKASEILYRFAAAFGPSR